MLFRILSGWLGQVTTSPNSSPPISSSFECQLRGYCYFHNVGAYLTEAIDRSNWHGSELTTLEIVGCPVSSAASRWWRRWSDWMLLFIVLRLITVSVTNWSVHASSLWLWMVTCLCVFRGELCELCTRKHTVNHMCNSVWKKTFITINSHNNQYVILIQNVTKATIS